MNVLMKVVDEVKYTIPYEILKLAFINPYQGWRNNTITIDEQILSTVIRPRVMVDCDIIAGMEVNIDLSDLTPNLVDNYFSVVTIPEEKLGNRTITSVLSLGYYPYYSNMNATGTRSVFSSPMYGNAVTNAAQRAGDSMSIVPILANTRIDIIGQNTVLIHEQWKIISAYFLRCMVSNDPDMNNIPTRSILDFAQLCIYAIKSYIYNKLIIKIDQTFLEGGQELGAVKNIIESYADAEELYKTYIKEKWRKISHMSDKTGYDRFIKLQVSPGI